MPLSRRTTNRPGPTTGQHLYSWKQRTEPSKPTAPQVSAETWERRDTWSRQRFEQLDGIVNESATDGLKFLATINLGGLAAVLAFMGSMKLTHLYLTGGGIAFMNGVFGVGTCYLYRYTYMAWLLDGWNRDYKGVMLGQREWRWAIVRDEQRCARFDWGAAIAVMSLLFFVTGATLAFMGAFQIAQKANPGIVSTAK
ncbi:hypothetical protein [Cupriavidus sp. RAF12]|uniref:hypothetical protein n=1 Tax=Cupriavidus sp. RAF12 TaxID=3233050 RepID=UPI003F8EAD29